MRGGCARGRARPVGVVVRCAVPGDLPGVADAAPWFGVRAKLTPGECSARAPASVWRGVSFGPGVASVPVPKLTPKLTRPGSCRPFSVRPVFPSRPKLTSARAARCTPPPPGGPLSLTGRQFVAPGAFFRLSRAGYSGVGCFSWGGSPVRHPPAGPPGPPHLSTAGPSPARRPSRRPALGAFRRAAYPVSRPGGSGPGRGG